MTDWEIPKLWLWQPCLNKLTHDENWETDHLQHVLYVDICIFTLAWVYVSHACTRITVHLHKWFDTFYRDSVLMKAQIFNNLKSWSHFHNSYDMYPSKWYCYMLFLFQWFVCTLLLQTIVIKCDYVLKQVQKLSLYCFSSLTITIFSPITSTHFCFHYSITSYHFIHSFIWYAVSKTSTSGSEGYSRYYYRHPFQINITINYH